MSIDERRAVAGMSAEDAARIRRNVAYCAVAAFAVGAVLWGFSKPFGSWFETSQVAHAKQQVQQIVAKFQGIYGNRPLDLGKWPTEVTAYAISGNFLPPEMLPPTVNCRDAGAKADCFGVGPWRGSVVRIYSGQEYDAIAVVYFNLDKSACDELAGAMVTPDPPLRLVVANISESNYMFPPHGNSQFPGALEIAQACLDRNANKVGLLYGMR
jgi:hypothetical protein